MADSDLHQGHEPSPIMSKVNCVMYKTKVKPYPHQVEALKRLKGKEAFAILMAMRTGKTKVTLDDFGRLELEGKARDLFIIAPAGVYRTWVTAMREHFSDDLRGRVIVHVWKSGMGSREKKELQGFMSNKLDPRVMLMNVEALSRPGDAREVAPLFVSQRSCYVAIDESTIIKNDSKRTKFINKFISPLAKYRRILSGLATPRSPLDLFYQFQFLDWRILGFNSYYTFRSSIAIMQKQWFGGRSVDLVVGFKEGAAEELQKLTGPHSYRVAFRPKMPSTYSIREVSMTEDQGKHYHEIREFATTKIAEDAHVTATVVIAQIMRMHQVLCGHTKDEQGVEHEIKENKTNELIALLEDYAGKAIIWCSYDTDVRKVAAALEKEYGEASAARFWGGNLKTREEEEKEFLNNPKCRFMIATPSAGGRGRTWTVADLVVYYSSTDNLEHREQSEQRAMGKDKARAVDFVDLISSGTIEMKILEALRKKINMSSAINGDNYKEWII